MSTVDKTEVEKFSKLAKDWWNPNGKFKPLHLFNPARINFIREKLTFYLKIDPKKSTPLKNINILDIGVGSGCILLSLLRELKTSRGTGIDVSHKAINIAKINAKKLNLLNRIKLKVFDINKFDFGKYDLIVSNPPYIPTRDIKKLSKSITNYEPLGALNGGADGLDLTKKVIYKCQKNLLITNY